MQLSIGIIPEGGKARGMGKEAVLDNIFVLDKLEVINDVLYNGVQ